MDEMMDQYLDRMEGSHRQGEQLSVPILDIQDDMALVDIGEKTEGFVPRRELEDEKGNLRYKPGDVIDVVVKGEDYETGMMELSHGEARKRAAYRTLEQAHKEARPIKARVVRATKGGLILDVGTTAFLPASQIDLRRVEDFEPWVGREIEGLIVEFNPQKRRIIVSRRGLLEREREAQRAELLKNLEVGQVLEVRVKNVVDFGAFVDMGGLDGLIPRGEISWDRSAHPNQYAKVDDRIQVRVIEIDEKSGKVTLSRRALAPDPWETASERYQAGNRAEGEVVSLTNYGAFVRLEEGLDGMIHISDMAWDAGGSRPSDYLKTGQKVETTILNVDPGQKRISLGLKQLTEDPWEGVAQRYPEGTRVKGKVSGLTKYGAFVEIEPGIEGMIHVSDFSWEKKPQRPSEIVNKGEEIEARVLSIDRERRRISLGVKQLHESPVMLYAANHRAGETVEGTISGLTDYGVFVKLTDDVEGFIHVSQLDKERVNSPQEKFKIGDRIEAEITRIETETGKISLSRRQMLKKETKKTSKQYMNINEGGGANLGELLAELKLEDDLPKE